MGSIIGFDSSVLLSYYSAQQTNSAVQAVSTASNSRASTSSSATDNTAPPWEDYSRPAQETRDAKILGMKSFLDTSNVARTAGSDDQKKAQDNQKLFSLYQALDNLSYLASMGKRDDTTPGQLTGYNNRFQAGMQEVFDYLGKTSFNNFTLQTAKPSDSVKAGISSPLLNTGYTGNTLVTGDAISDPLPKISTADSFTVSINAGGVVTDVPIDLSQISGDLTLDNVVNYTNQQLSNAGFGTRFKRVITSGSINDPKTAKYGISISASGSERVSLSSAAATPALYIAGSSGSATGTSDVDPNQQGRLIKLTGLGGSPQSAFNAATNPTNGLTTAQSTVTDANGNVYVLGNATGDFGNLLNQGDQDVYLTKYDSNGKVSWQQMLGSTGTASGYALSLDPTGGVVIAGSTTAKLTQTSIADGKNDSFVAKYDSSGNRKWVNQIQTLNDNTGLSVSVDASGNVVLAGQVTGSIGAGQTNQGGTDAYLATFDSKGKLTAEQQYGTAGDDAAGAVTTMADGSVLVASVQNGHAIVSKYAGGDITAAPAWQKDLGDLQSQGAIGGIAVSGNEIYISGTTSNPALDAGGEASIASAANAGNDAFVFHLSDNGASATAATVSYLGTSAKDSAGNLSVAADGTVYVAGTTTGTFAGQSRSVDGTNNAFVSALNSDGTVAWTRQYGGASGTSTGNAVALDTTGSSVLDALGLPRGTVQVEQSADLTQMTNLRAGDSFSLKIAGVGGRTAKITIGYGETLRSLATKINASLVQYGNASVAYGGGGKTLKIDVTAGHTVSLISGPDGFDALSRLGFDPVTITKPADSKSASTSGSTDGSATSQVFGLGLTMKLDISTKTGAGSARAQLLNALTAIRDAYRTSNAPANAAPLGNNSGTAPAYLTNQVASYNLALNLLQGGSSGSGGLGSF